MVFPASLAFASVNYFLFPVSSFLLKSRAYEFDTPWQPASFCCTVLNIGLARLTSRLVSHEGSLRSRSRVSASRAWTSMASACGASLAVHWIFTDADLVANTYFLRAPTTRSSIATQSSQGLILSTCRCFLVIYKCNGDKS